MAPRPPGRSKAADIPELSVLTSVLSGSSELGKFPEKVREAKFKKLEARGLIRRTQSGPWKLTQAGLMRLQELS